MTSQGKYNVRFAEETSKSCSSFDSKSVIHNNNNSTSSVKCKKLEDINVINDNNNNNKLPWKMKKQQIKEEKRRRREEDIRRKIIAPKSQHLKIIDRSIKDTFTAATSDDDKRKNVGKCKERNDFELNCLLSEFPDLSVSYSRNKKNVDGIRSSEQLSVKQKTVKTVPKSEIENSNVKNKFDLNNDINAVETLCHKCSSSYLNDNTLKNKNGCKVTHVCTTETDNSTISCSINNDNEKRKKKKVKKNDPIEFNIISALELQSRQKVFKSHQWMKKSIKKKRLLSGNELDSDRPMRKRGKYRENAGKKLTKVKRLVLNERQVRMQLKNESKLKLLNFSKLTFDNTLDRNDLFYNHLKTIKLFSDCIGDTDFTDSTRNIKGGPSECNKNNDDNKINPKLLIHSRKFKQYCDQWPNKEMNENVHSLIKTVVRFQDRHYDCDPIKAYARRRYVCGFHEVLRYLNINKAKLVIIATDIECGDGEGSLFDYISRVTKVSEEFAIPYVYCGSRWSLKSCFKKKSPISCAAILHYDGAEELFKNVVRLIPEVNRLYAEKLNEAEIKCGDTRQVEEDVRSMCIRSVLDSLSMDNNGNCHDNNMDIHNIDKISCCNEDCDGQEEELEEGKNCPFMSALLKCSKNNNVL